MEYSEKTLFIKSNKVGDGELGTILMKGFLSAISQQKEIPKSLIFVNDAILLTTSGQDDEIIEIIKTIEAKGSKVYSCGTCLDFFNKRDDLKVGVAGNAMDTAKMLLTEDIVTL